MRNQGVKLINIFDMDKEQDQVALVIKETEREMSHADIDFIVSLVTEWLIRDYLRKKCLTEAK